VKRVLTAVILIPIVIVVLFRAPLWLFTLLVLGMALLAAREYFDIAKKAGFQPFEAVIYFFFLCGFGLLTYESFNPSDYSPGVAVSFAVLVVACPFVFLISGLSRSSAHAISDPAVSLLVLPYIGVPLGFMVFLRGMNDGALFLLFLMLLVWCGDIAAYYVGRAVGKHRLAPRISPGKTWEGAVASVVAAVIVGVLLFHYVNPIAGAFQSARLLLPSSTLLPPSTRYAVPRNSAPTALAIAPFQLIAWFAICVNVAAQVGDLVESALKRGAGVKDSGTLLPGHGGVLDRIDALLFALPVGLLFYAFGMSRYFEPGAIR